MECAAVVCEAGAVGEAVVAAVVSEGVVLEGCAAEVVVVEIFPKYEYVVQNCVNYSKVFSTFRRVPGVTIVLKRAAKECRQRRSCWLAIWIMA